ncbi:hypothetical protein GCM10009836_69050 [Pseudonocardia ailaonensis]|uniref:DUF5753 domain-containing protein n=1 Tax=Pseudonocardia ailaonensis TaxID=367279 RepID=A0ABN2NNU2_9PSEU
MTSSPGTEWFTVSATPMPHLAAWTLTTDGRLDCDRTVLLVSQRLYRTHPVRDQRDEDSAWLDSQVQLAVVDPSGLIYEQDILGDLLGFYHESVTEADVRAANQELIEKRLTEHRAVFATATKEN